MRFPQDRNDINTNMPESEFVSVVSKLAGGEYVNIAPLDNVDWFVNLDNVRYEVTAENGVITGLYRK